MITHYLPAVVNADKIFVGGVGHLVEQGTPRELLAHGEVYQQLWNSQSQLQRNEQLPTVTSAPQRNKSH